MRQSKNNKKNIQKIFKYIRIKKKKLFRILKNFFKKIKKYFKLIQQNIWKMFDEEQNYIKMSIFPSKEYKSFSPKNDITYENENIKMFISALSDRNNKNIAISGKYGAGKSSIIKSFFKSKYNRWKFKPLYISLGMFEINENIEDVNKFSQQIEKSIIQQILYSEKIVNLPDSNINRTTKLRMKHINSIIGLMASLLIFILLKVNEFNLKNTFEYIKKGIDNLLLYLNPNNYKQLWNIIKTISFSDILTYSVLVLIFAFIVKLVADVFRRFKIKSIKIGTNDTAIELSKKDGESLINKYLDELVYFFSKTNYRTVIIEDLDRFLVDKCVNVNNCQNIKENENSIIDCNNCNFVEKYNQKILIIFQKLKELNEILNNSKEIKQDIKFVYAVKDDIFKKSLERTKFFDFIIPVIPILGTYNSYAQLEEKINDLENNLKIKRRDRLNKTLIKDLAEYIDDYRLMTSILNEYIFYIKNIERDNLDKNKLFAMIVLKNIKPNEYDSLMENKGNIFKLLNSSSEIIQRLTDNKLQKINLNNEKIKEIKAENLNSFKELKAMILGSLSHKNVSSYGSNGLTETQFLDDSVTIQYIEKNTINIQVYNGRYNTYNENELFDGDKQSFIKRAKIIESKYNKELEFLKNENITLKREIDNLKRKRISELLEYDREYIKEHEIDIMSLEYKLISKNYIDQNYAAYMYKFKSTTEHTLEDETFIYNNKHYSALPINYKLVNPKEVIDELELKFFGIKNILNFDITTFLLNTNEKIYKDKKREFIKLLTGNIDTDSNEEIINFIYSYINEVEEQDENKLIMELYNYDDKIISRILSFFVDDYEQKYDFIIKRIINCPLIVENESIKTEIVDYIIELSDFETWIELNENVKASLKKLNIKFENLDKQNGKNLIKFIYENNLYICNSNMIQHIFEYKEYDYNSFNTMNFSCIIKDEKLALLKEQVLNNKTQYIEQCYLKTNNMNTEIGDITNIINSWEIDNGLKEKIIQKMSQKLDNILNVSKKEYCDLYLKYNKVKVDWKNIYDYYEKNNFEINEELIKFIERNIDDILKLDILKINRTPQFLEMCMKIAKNNIIEFEVYKKIIPKLRIMIDIDLEEMKSERLRILVLNKMIKFNSNNFMVISKELVKMLDYYVAPHIDEFIKNIDEFEINDEIINYIIKSEKIRFKYKTKIIQNIRVELLNDDTLEYIINNYNKTKIAKIRYEVKEKIFSSQVKIVNKIKFLNLELDFESSYEKIKKYLQFIGEPHSLIGDYEMRNTTFSIPKYNDSLVVLKKLLQKGFLFSYNEHNETIVIHNKKQ